MRRWIRVAVFVVSSLGIATLGLAAAAPASAHAALVGSDPADGARLAAAPSQVRFTFGEAVSLGEGGYVRVIDQHGDVASVGNAAHPTDSAHPQGDPAAVATTLRSGLGAGTYLASYRVVSEDSHPVTGSSRFVVGDGELADIKANTHTTNPGLSWVYDAVRGLGFAGLTLLGGGWLLLTVWPQGRADRRAQAALWCGWSATVLATGAQLLVQGAYAAGLGVGGVLKANLLNETLHSVVGIADAVRLLLLAALAVVFSVVLQDGRPTNLRVLAATLGIGAVVTFVLAGHAYSQNPRWLALGSQTLHVIAMAVWLGGLVMLLLAMLRSQAKPSQVVLRRFTQVAYVCVSTLIITGTYQTWLGVGTWHALVSTTYGRLVIAKVAGLIGMLGFAYFSRRSVGHVVLNKRRGLARLRQLRSSVISEAVIGAVVLALTAVLVAEPPGRNVEAAAAATKETTVSIDMTASGSAQYRSAALTVSPSRAGVVQVMLHLEAGWPQNTVNSLSPLTVSLSAAQPAKQIGPITLDLKGMGDDMYAASATLPVPGLWTFAVRVQTSEFDAVTANTNVTLR